MTQIEFAMKISSDNERPEGRPIRAFYYQDGSQNHIVIRAGDESDEIMDVDKIVLNTSQARELRDFLVFITRNDK